MRKIGSLVVLVSVLVLLATSVCFAATIEGGGKQTRGYPGHDAELYGEVFVLPRQGTIASIAGEGTDGFWIETATGQLVVSFDSFKQAVGYTLPAGSYRALPNLRDYPEKAPKSWVRITINCP